MHIFLCIALFFNVYLILFPANLSHPTISRLWGDRGDVAVISVRLCMCAAPNTESLSTRNRESDSSAVWQPLLSLWSQHRSGTDLMRCAKSKACFCSVSFLSRLFSSQYACHPPVFLLLFRSNYLLFSLLCLDVLFCYNVYFNVRDLFHYVESTDV